MLRISHNVLSSLTSIETRLPQVYTTQKSRGKGRTPPTHTHVRTRPGAFPAIALLRRCMYHEWRSRACGTLTHLVSVGLPARHLTQRDEVGRDGRALPWRRQVQHGLCARPRCARPSAVRPHVSCTLRQRLNSSTRRDRGDEKEAVWGRRSLSSALLRRSIDR